MPSPATVPKQTSYIQAACGTRSVALGCGFRCGFLGLLHLEIMQGRLEHEFEIDLITTAPGVRYKVTTTDGTPIDVNNPTKFPDPSEIKQIEEPIIDATVIT